MSDSERYNEWQQMTMSGTTGDKDLQRMRATGFYSIFFFKNQSLKIFIQISM